MCETAESKMMTGRVSYVYCGLRVSSVLGYAGEVADAGGSRRVYTAYETYEAAGTEARYVAAGATPKSCPYIWIS